MIYDNLYSKKTVLEEFLNFLNSEQICSQPITEWKFETLKFTFEISLLLKKIHKTKFKDL